MKSDINLEDNGSSLLISDPKHTDIPEPSAHDSNVVFVTLIALVTLLFGALLGVLGVTLLLDNESAITGLYQWLPRAGLLVLGGLSALLVLK